MAFGDPGGHFQGGYGGNFPGYGGSSMASQPGGPEHGSLGFGGMSPGGYNSTTYANNMAGVPGTPGFGARRASYQAAAAQQKSRSKSSTGAGAGTVSAPVTQSPILGPLDTPPAVAPTTTTTAVPIPRSKPVSTGAYYDPNWSRPEGEWGYPNSSQFDGSWPNNNDFGNQSLGGQAGTYSGFGGNSTRGGSQGPQYRQFGGPVAPGQQYTVGENGPETLHMGAQGGQVVPNNPVDRLGGMNPGMMQALFQLMQQRRPQAPQMPQPPQPPQMPQAPQMPQMRPPMGQGPGAGGGFRLGDWRNRMGIEGLSRPARQPSMGFGGSGLGTPGIMPQMQRRPGFGG